MSKAISLLEAFGQVPDPRDAQGRRHPLPAILALTAGRAAAGWESVSLDGKTLRGTQGHQVPGIHLLAAYAHEARVVLDQIPVGAKTNEHKTALHMLDLIPLEGKVVTADAAFCQRDLSRTIRKKGAIGSGR